ncbi:hypothetical protein [Streptomyces typhae]|uniref:hypothetical protein n=1 Tax=Streptomyces typhae TaxID=2681492 RepID=UPI003CCCB327
MRRRAALDARGEATVAQTFIPPEPPAEQQLTVLLHTQHAPTAELLLGRSLSATTPTKRHPSAPSEHWRTLSWASTI